MDTGTVGGTISLAKAWLSIGRVEEMADEPGAGAIDVESRNVP
jgi:hypothetical protein